MVVNLDDLTTSVIDLSIISDLEGDLTIDSCAFNTSFNEYLLTTIIKLGTEVDFFAESRKVESFYSQVSSDIGGMVNIVKS